MPGCEQHTMPTCKCNGKIFLHFMVKYHDDEIAFFKQFALLLVDTLIEM